MVRLRRWFFTRIGLVVCALATPALAMAWPDRPITLEVGYAAGGGTDFIARLVALELSKQLGQSVIVENKGGANGNLAAGYAARASGDGYTLLFGGSNHVTNTSLYPKLPFNFNTDLVPVGLVASLPNLLVVHPSVPVKNVQELIALAKAEPGKLNFGSSGIGSSQHLAGELFMRMAGIKMTHVPYRGSAPAVADLLAGNIQMMFDNATSALPNARSGRVRALAFTSEQRSKSDPAIPTISESGLKGFNITAWLGVFAPVKTPVAIQEQLNQAILKLVAQPDFQKKLLALSADPMTGNLKQSADFVASENLKWSKIIHDVGVQLD